MESESKKSLPLKLKITLECSNDANRDFQKSNPMIRANLRGKLTKNAFLFWTSIMHILQRQIRKANLNPDEFQSNSETSLDIPYKDFKKLLEPLFPKRINPYVEIKRATSNLLSVYMELKEPKMLIMFNLMNSAVFDDENEILTIQINSIFLRHLLHRKDYTSLNLQHLSMTSTLYGALLYDFFEFYGGRENFTSQLDLSDLKKDGLEIELKDLKKIYPEIEYTLNRDNNSIIFYGLDTKFSDFTSKKKPIKVKLEDDEHF